MLNGMRGAWRRSQEKTDGDSLADAVREQMDLGE